MGEFYDFAMMRSRARYEYALFLRREGLTLREIGLRIEHHVEPGKPVSAERVRQIIYNALRQEAKS